VGLNGSVKIFSPRDEVIRKQVCPRYSIVTCRGPAGTCVCCCSRGRRWWQPTRRRIARRKRMLRRIRYSFGKVSAETGTMKDALQGELILSSSRLRRAARSGSPKACKLGQRRSGPFDRGNVNSRHRPLRPLVPSPPSRSAPTPAVSCLPTWGKKTTNYTLRSSIVSKTQCHGS
jgi:hypothetical protein